MSRQSTLNLVINADASGLNDALAEAKQGIAALNQEMASIGAQQPLTKGVRADTQGALAARRSYGDQSIEEATASAQQLATVQEQAALDILEAERACALQAGEATTEIDRQILAEKQTWANQMQSITARGLQAETRSIEQSFGAVPAAMTRSITGVLTGTMNMRQALGNVARSVIATLVEIPVKMATEWAAREIATLALHQEIETAKTAATGAGEAARADIRTSSAAAGATAEATAGSTSVIGDAYRAAAGTYASVAEIPIVGPFLAPAAAAAAFAAVGAFDVFSAEGGWDRVPKGGALTMLHENEMVLPAGIAAPLRAIGNNPGAGSGGDTHFHVSAPFTQNGGAPNTRAMAREIANQHLDVLVAGLQRAHRSGRLLPGVTRR
jgi:hypothetical protein